MVRCKECKMEFTWLKNKVCGYCNQKSKAKTAIRYWSPKGINGNKMQKFSEWINGWADFSEHIECLDDKYTIGKEKKPNHITDYGRGYKQATSDIFRKLGLDYKLSHKRTKTGIEE